MGRKRIVLTYPSLKGLWQWFAREIERRDIDPAEIDVESYLDPTLTVNENKEILKTILYSPITETEAGDMYEEYKTVLQEQVRTKYPEILEPLEERIIELERTEKTSKRRYKKIKALEQQLLHTERLLEEEKAKPPEVAPVKVHVLKPFTEGIIDYTVGSVIETRDLDWVLEKINRGMIERVGVEVPVKRAPPAVPPIPKHQYLTDEEVGRLWQEFVAYGVSLRDMKEPRHYRERFMAEIRTAKDYEVASKRGRRLVDAILKEISPPLVRPPPVPRRVRAPILEPVAQEPAFEKYLKCCGIDMATYRRLNSIGRNVMRREFRRWLKNPW